MTIMAKIRHLCSIHTNPGRRAEHKLEEMESGIKMGAPFKRNGARFQIKTPFRRFNGSSITKKNQALKAGNGLCQEGKRQPWRILGMFATARSLLLAREI
jgi:hypothetical protein